MKGDYFLTLFTQSLINLTCYGPVIFVPCYVSNADATWLRIAYLLKFRHLFWLLLSMCWMCCWVY